MIPQFKYTIYTINATYATLEVQRMVASAVLFTSYVNKCNKCSSESKHDRLYCEKGSVRGPRVQGERFWISVNLRFGFEDLIFTMRKEY